MTRTVTQDINRREKSEMTKKNPTVGMKEQVIEALKSGWRPTIVPHGWLIRQRSRFPREKEIYYIWHLPEDTLPDSIVGRGDWRPEYERLLGEAWDGFRKELRDGNFADLVAKRKELKREAKKLSRQESRLREEKRIWLSLMDLADQLIQRYDRSCRVCEVDQDMLVIPSDFWDENSEEYIVPYSNDTTVEQLCLKLSDRKSFDEITERISSSQILREALDFKHSVLKSLIEYEVRFGTAPTWSVLRKHLGSSALPDPEKLAFYHCLLVRLLLREETGGNWVRKTESEILRDGHVTKLSATTDIYWGMASLANESLNRGESEVSGEAIEKEFSRHIKPSGPRSKFNLKRHYRLAELWADEYGHLK